MSRAAKPKPSLLTYDGVIYEIGALALTDLLANGVIIPDLEAAGAFRLSPDHLFEEVDQYATPVWRRPGFDPRGPLMSMLSSHRDGQGGR